MDAQIAQKMKIKGSLKRFIRKSLIFEGKNNIVSTNLNYSNDCCLYFLKVKIQTVKKCYKLVIMFIFLYYLFPPTLTLKNLKTMF